jgi:hypothetical protein
MEKDLLNSENWKKCGDNKPKAFRLKVHKSDCNVRKELRDFQSGDSKILYGLAEIENSSEKNYNYGHKWAIKEKPDSFTYFRPDVNPIDSSTMYENHCEIGDNVDVNKKLVLNVNNTSGDRFKIIPDFPDPDATKLPSSNFDYAYKLKYNETTHQYNVTHNYRIDFHGTNTQYRVVDVQLNSKFMIVKLEEATSLADYMVYVRGLDKDSFVYAKSLKDVIEDYEETINFMPAEDTLNGNEVYEPFEYDLQVNSYGTKILLKVHRAKITNGQANSRVEFSRHYLMEWNDCKHKFEVLDFLDTSKANRIQKDVPNYDSTNYVEMNDAYNANARRKHLESHVIDFEYILTPTDDILIYSKYSTSYSTSIETFNLSCDGTWGIGHKLSDNNFHKYSFNEETHKLEKISERTDLLPFPDMNETGMMAGTTTSSWNAWPQIYWNSDYSYFGNSNPFYYFGEAKSGIQFANIIHFDKDHLILDLEIIKPWKNIHHSYSKKLGESCSRPSSTSTPDGELIDRYIIKYKVNELGKYEIVSKSNVNDYHTQTSNIHLKFSEIVHSRYINENKLLVKNYRRRNQDWWEYRNSDTLNKRLNSHLIIESWYDQQIYNISYGMNVDPLPSGTENIYSWRVVDMSSDTMEFQDLTWLTENVTELVGENEHLMNYTCNGNDILFLIAKFEINDGNVLVTNTRLEIYTTTDYVSFAKKQTINYSDLYPTDRNNNQDLLGNKIPLDYGNILNVIDNMMIKNYMNINQDIILT